MGLQEKKIDHYTPFMSRHRKANKSNLSRTCREWLLTRRHHTWGRNAVLCQRSDSCAAKTCVWCPLLFRAITPLAPSTNCNGSRLISNADAGAPPWQLFHGEGGDRQEDRYPHQLEETDQAGDKWFIVRTPTFSMSVPFVVGINLSSR